MPELPDLTVVAEQLAARAAGKTVAEATAPTPILLRATPADLDALRGLQLGQARRRGKFLVLPLERDAQPAKLLAANPMLAGRFWLMDDSRERVRARTGLRLRFTDGGELRYVDREMLVEAIGVMRKLWDGDLTSHRGAYLNALGMALENRLGTDDRADG